MTGTQEIHYKADEITMDASNEKIYYEGQLETKEIPWNIKMRYFLNGKEYSADNQQIILRREINRGTCRFCTHTIKSDLHIFWRICMYKISFLLLC